jgi:hypothetical protein
MCRYTVPLPLRPSITGPPIIPIKSHFRFTVTLEEADIEQIISSLVWESKLAVISEPSNSAQVGEGAVLPGKRYKAQSRTNIVDGLLATPCGVCAVIDKCAEGSDISPEACTYFADW